jgi:arylsulfatase A-like enzyme
LTKGKARPALVILGLLLAGAGGWFAFRGSGPKRPDILIVLWDTCRADRLSAYGHPVETTPWLSRFAKDAVLFKQAFAPSPCTPPSHGSLFTGLLPRSHGLLQGLGDRLHPGIPTLAQTLRNAGYETVGFTANSFISELTGLDAGFDRMVPVYLEDTGTGWGRAERVIAAVDAWLKEREAASSSQRAKPVFVFVNLMDVHLPRTPPPEDLAFVVGPKGVHPVILQAAAVESRDAAAHVFGIKKVDDAIVAAMAPVYDAAVRHLDRSTGVLVDKLRAASLIGDGAVVAVVADHGDHLGEHGLLSHEMTLYDAVLRIPMVVRWPGRLDGGRVETAQVRLQDLYPTLLEAARVPIPAGTGLHAKPLTESPLPNRVLRAEYERPTAFLPEALLAFEGAAPEHFQKFHVSIDAVQDPAGPRGSRKLIRFSREGGVGPPEPERYELYDMRADPAESKDLLQAGAPEEKAEAERLRGLILR